MIARLTNRAQDWLYRTTVIEKLRNPVGLLMLTCIALLCSFAFIYGGAKGGFALLGVAIILPVVFASIFQHQLGVVIMLLIGFSIQFIGKYVSAPVGISMDAMLMLMLVGIIIQQIRQRDWSFAKSPITPFVFIWIATNLFQGLNPWAESRMAWLYTVRSMALLIMLYFIACNAFTTKKRVIWMINFTLFCGFIAALWAFKQEYFGFTEAEETWLYSDEKRFELIFQWTRYRLFSLFNDPTTFGIMMAYMAIMTLILALGKQSKARTAWLVFMTLIMTAANSFTGTRTAFVLMPIGLVLFVIMKPTKEILIFIGIFFLLGTAFIMKGTSSALIYRIQSAFNPTEDESLKVRIRNQAFIQPHIQKHPIGFGLGSCGEWGKRFSPDSWLSTFPHDSGYVRIAIELGWTGLAIYLLFLVVVLRTSIYYYFRVKDPTIKHYYLTLTVGVFMLMVANYPQEAIVQLPTSLVFYIFLAAIARLKDFDPAFSEEAEILP